jgi:hypothetical protein
VTAETKVDWPSFQFLDVEKLAMDKKYQRDLSKKRVARIADEFDPDLFGAITVSARDDGTFAVIDGQHRTVGASLRGIKQVPAFVTSANDVHQEASTFVSVNTLRKATTPYQTWNAAAFADAASPEARSNKILAEHGLRIAAHGGANTIKAVGTLKWILDRGEVPLLEDTINILDKHWRGMDNCFADKLIKGVAMFLWIYEDKISWDRLNFALEEELRSTTTIMTPTRMLQKAAVSSLQGIQPAVVSNLLIKSYNSKNKSKIQHRDTRPNKTLYKGFVY